MAGFRSKDLFDTFDSFTGSLSEAHLAKKAMDRAKEVGLYEARVGLGSDNSERVSFEEKVAMGFAPPTDSSVVAPVNFGTVLPGLYRSGYPQPQNFEYLKKCGLKTIVTLVDKEFPPGYEEWMRVNKIRHVVFDMAGTKKEAIPDKTMDSILKLVMSKENYPLLIHCNHGKHRTGCVVGVVRHCHSWNVKSIVEEYTKYAEPKTRETDISYITNFQVTNVISNVATRVIAAEPHPSVSRKMKAIIFNLVLLLCFIFLVSHQQSIDWDLSNHW